MTTNQLQAVLEVIQHLSTLIVFVLLLAITAKFLLSMTFSMDLLLIIVAFFGLRILSKHQPTRRMGRQVGMHPLYTKRQCDELFQIFLAGYRAEETARAAQAT